MTNSHQPRIIGVGMTRFGKHEASTVVDLAGEAASMALHDAGLERSDIQALAFGNVTQGQLEGQHSIVGQVVARRIGFQAIPIYNVENACATGSTALHLAVAQVASGAVDVAMALGVEKMNVPDRARTMGVFDSGFDVANRAGVLAELRELSGEDIQPDARRSIFMDIYAAQAKAHMKRFGSTQNQFAHVAAKNHTVAALNDRAFFRDQLSLAEILEARLVVDPFTVPMCSPITDGAAAVVVCSPSFARQLGVYKRSVGVLASQLMVGQDRDLTDLDAHITRIASTKAYAAAGVGPTDIDVAEVHDATSFAEVLQSEMLGLCVEGEGGPAAVRGETSLGGRIPINVSGGLVSKGHPIAATGLAQITDLVHQLRGEAGPRQVNGARIALAENGGGYIGGEDAITALTIIGK